MKRSNLNKEQLKCSKNSIECNGEEFRAIVEVKDGSGVSWFELLQRMSCKEHRKLLEPNSPHFLAQKGRLENFLGISNIWIDTAGTLLGFSLKFEKLRNSSDFYNLILRQQGLVSWLKTATSEELAKFRHEVEVLLLRNPEYNELREALSVRKVTERSMSLLFSAKQYQIWGIFLKNEVPLESLTAIIDPWNGSALYEPNKIKCRIHRKLLSPGQLATVQIKSDLLTKTFFLKAGDLSIDAAYVSFCRYLRTFCDVPIFEIRCFDGFAVMENVEGLLLRDFKDCKNLDGICLLRSLVRTALPLFLTGGADRHHENYIIRADSRFQAIDFTFLFGRQPASPVDCFGIGVTAELKHFFTCRGLWDMLLEEAMYTHQLLADHLEDVCRVADFYFSHLFPEIQVADFVRQRMSSPKAFTDALEPRTSTSVKNIIRNIKGNYISPYFNGGDAQNSTTDLYTLQ